MDKEVEDLKRKAFEEEEQDGREAKRVEVAPAPTQMTQMANEDFNHELLRVYYERLFPYLSMYRWLSYGNRITSSNRVVDRDHFFRREFCFVLQGDVFCRYQCFKDEHEFKKAVLQQQPIRMEIGAVYSHPPKNHNTVVKEAYKPKERELVFDIDMDDYDDIRTCCQGSKLCMKCWNFMRAAMKVLTRVLKEDFGFKHFFFVYSGRRGMHCWVADRVARQLSDAQRSGVAEYCSLHATGANKPRADLRLYGASELHPSIEEAYKLCETYFRDDPNSVLKAQDILRKGPHLANILQGCSSEDNAHIKEYLKKFPEADSCAIWKEFEMLAERKRAASRNLKHKDYKQNDENQVLLKDVVIQFTYPRLDINVSKQMNHLLKAPFVVHPKTGRVCVPIDPEDIDTFNPHDVPTIGRLVTELGTNDPPGTSLKKYTHYFETQFLKPLEDEELQSHRKGDFSF